MNNTKKKPYNIEFNFDEVPDDLIFKAAKRFEKEAEESFRKMIIESVTRIGINKEAIK